jgi:hypothetical protein
MIALLTKWKKDHPACTVFAMVAESNMESVQVIQHCCREVGIGLVGAVCPRLIASSQIQDRGVLLHRMDGIVEYVLSDKITSVDALNHVMDELLLSLNDKKRQTLLLLFDAMLPNISTLLDQCYLKIADKVSYVGASAGSESFQSMPCLFDLNRFESDGVLALLCPEKMETFVKHGYLTPENHITATSSSNNCVHSIEWLPAFDVYQEIAYSDYGVTVTKDNFYSIGVKFPFGIIRACGDVLVRIPVGLGDDGSLICSDEVPENAMLTLLKSSEQDMMKGIVDFSKEIQATGVSVGPVFYCAGRALFLGRDNVQRELNVVSQSHGSIHGMITLGEIGCTNEGSYPVLHNAAIACCAYSA